MMNRTYPFQSWLAFTKALELQFGPSVFECPKSTLFKLQQTSLVQDYHLQFTALANRNHGLSPNALLGCFISGLKPELMREVLVQQPITLLKVVAIAKLFEEKSWINFPSDYPILSLKLLITNPGSLCKLGKKANRFLISCLQMT